MGFRDFSRNEQAQAKAGARSIVLAFFFGKLDQRLEDGAQRCCRNRLPLVGNAYQDTVSIAMDAKHHGHVEVSILGGVEKEIGEQLMQPDAIK